jgi:hypothetical protein
LANRLKPVPLPLRPAAPLVRAPFFPRAARRAQAVQRAGRRGRRTARPRVPSRTSSSRETSNTPSRPSGRSAGPAPQAAERSPQAPWECSLLGEIGDDEPSHVRQRDDRFGEVAARRAVEVEDHRYIVVRVQPALSLLEHNLPLRRRGGVVVSARASLERQRTKSHDPFETVLSQTYNVLRQLPRGS